MAGGTHSNINKPNKRKIHTNTLWALWAYTAKPP